MTDDDGVDERLNVNESADKLRLNAQLTRGTGTRDQEKITLKARGDDADDVADDIGRLLDRLDDGIARTARSIQPTDVGEWAAITTIDAFDALHRVAEREGIDPESWELEVVGITDEGDVSIALGEADDGE